MKRTKKTLLVLLIVLIAFSILFLYHITNHYYEDNFVRKIIRGLNLVLTPTLIALVLTYLLEPLVRYLMHRFKMRRLVAIIVVMTLFVILFVGIIVFLVSFMISQGNIILENIQANITGSELLAQIRAWAEANGLENIYDAIEKAIKDYDYMSLFENANGMIGSILRFGSALILAPIFLWYFLNGKDKIFDGITSVFPDKWQPHIHAIGSDSNQMIRSYFKSKVISMIFLFFMFSFVFLFLGMDLQYVIFFAVIISVLDLIPYIGPFIGNLIPSIYLLANNGTELVFINSFHVNAIVAIVILLVLNTIIQFVQGNIIVPKLAGKEMEINALLILSSMLFFGSVFGVWGIILSIPLCGIIIVVIKYLKSGVLDTDDADAPL